MMMIIQTSFSYLYIVVVCSAALFSRLYVFIVAYFDNLMLENFCWALKYISYQTKNVHKLNKRSMQALNYK